MRIKFNEDEEDVISLGELCDDVESYGVFITWKNGEGAFLVPVRNRADYKTKYAWYLPEDREVVGLSDTPAKALTYALDHLATEHEAYEAIPIDDTEYDYKILKIMKASYTEDRAECPE